MSLPLRARRLSSLAGIAAVLVLVGCTSSPPPTVSPEGTSLPGCVPLFSVTPQEVAPGGTVTLTSNGDCTPPTPPEGWTIIAAPVGDPDAGVRTPTTQAIDEAFRLEVTLPADFPEGQAVIGLEDWDHSGCSDSASCASPTADFTVVAATP